MIKNNILSAMFMTVIMALPMVSSAQEKTTLLHVSGMTCGICPITIRHHVLNMKGVHDAVVDIKNATATVSYDDQRQSPESISQSITHLGYPTMHMINPKEHQHE